MEQVNMLKSVWFITGNYTWGITGHRIYRRFPIIGISLLGINIYRTFPTAALTRSIWIIQNVKRSLPLTYYLFSDSIPLGLFKFQQDLQKNEKSGRATGKTLIFLTSSIWLTLWTWYRKLLKLFIRNW